MSTVKEKLKLPHEAVESLVARLYQIEREQNIFLGSIAALMIMYRSTDSVTTAQVADQLGTERPTANRMLNGLCGGVMIGGRMRAGRGLAVSRVSHIDNKTMEYEITLAGRKLVETLLPQNQ
jgi:hypothetical protein